MSVTGELRRRLPSDRSLRPFEPCLPRTAKQPPTGPGWIHEIKHDGFRILARRDGNGVRLFTRNGYNFAARFPRIAEAAANIAKAPELVLKPRSGTGTPWGRSGLVTGGK